MISGIGLASGRPNGQALEEEETDISQGGNAHVRHSPPFRQRGGNIGAAARHHARQLGPRQNTGSSGSCGRRHHGAKAAEINRRTAGSSQLTLASVFSPDSGICLYAGTARLPPRRILAKCATSSRQTAAWKCRRKKKKRKKSKTRACLAAEKSGGGVFTSPPFLLPRAVGNQLLRTGKTPFVPPPLRRLSRQSSAQASQCRGRPLLANRDGCTWFKKWRNIILSFFTPTPLSFTGKFGLFNSLTAETNINNYYINF